MTVYPININDMKSFHIFKLYQCVQMIGGEAGTVKLMFCLPLQTIILYLYWIKKELFKLSFSSPYFDLNLFKRAVESSYTEIL